MTQIIQINKQLVDSIDLTSLLNYIDWNDNSKYFDLEAGKEHYKLIAYLATQITGKQYIDIGTYFGFSALALSLDDNHQVVTYDVCDWIPDNQTSTVKNKTNIEMKLMNCVNDMDIVSKVDLIILDIDPHDGVEEQVIIKALEENGFSGILLLDDIHLNKDMQMFWDNITQKKYDLTTVGHWSGTGALIFDPSRFDISLN